MYTSPVLAGPYRPESWRKDAHSSNSRSYRMRRMSAMRSAIRYWRIVWRSMSPSVSPGQPVTPRAPQPRLQWLSTLPHGAGSCRECLATREASPNSRWVVDARSPERRHPDAQVGDGEAVQEPRPAARDLLGLRAPQRGEFALEAQPRELFDHAPADGVGDLVAARAEDVNCRAGGHEIGLGAGLKADT